jgi:PRA1 family protein
MALGVTSGSADRMASGGGGGGGGVSNKSTGHHQVMIDFETMRHYVASLASEIQGRVSLDTLRPLTLFLGIADPSNISSSSSGSSSSCFMLSTGAFTPPVQKLDKMTLEKVTTRMKLNGAFFLSNYVLLAVMVALVVALMHPSMILFVAICYSLWSLHHFLISNQLVVFGINVHALLSIQQRFYILFTVTTIVVVMKCLVPTIYFFSISALMILSHAFLRDPKHTENSSRNLLLSNDVDRDDDVEGGGGSGSDSSLTSDEVLVERPPLSK